MKKLKLFFACLLMAVLSIGQVWGQAAAGTTLFSENFGSYSANNVPSGSVTTAIGRVVYGDANVTYTCADNGSNKTMIYAANLAGGTSPELLVGKNAGVFTIADIPSGGAQEITVSFKQNAQKLTVSVSGDGYSTDYASPKPSAAGTVSFDITVADGAANTFTLSMAAGSSNVRVDDILLTVKTAGEGGGSDPVAVTGVTLNKSELELEVDENETLTATVAPGDATDKSVSWSSDDESVATVANGVVTAVAEGTATITVTTTDGSFTDECEVTVIAAAPAVEYVKFTGDIEEGDYVIYYDGKAMKNTVASNRLSYESVTPTNNKVKNPSAAIVWHIAPAATEGYWTMYNEEVSKYAVCTGSNNQANLNASADNAIVSVVEVSEGNYNILSKVRQDAGSNNYYLRNNGTYGFAFYGSGTGGALTLYKNNSAAPAVAKPTISGTDNFLTSTEVTMECSTDGAAIYYTTTESAKTTPATSGDWAAYNSASKPSFSATTTIWAAAKKGDDWSAVAEKTFTKATVMTVAQALAASAGANQYVKGIISSIDEVSTEHGNATYYLKDEGQENSIKIYRGKYLDNANFTAADQIIVGDEVTVTGTISVYSEVNQFAQGNYIVAMKPAARLAWAGTTEGAYNASLEGENTFPTLTNTNSVEVAYSSSDESAATINPSTGAISLVGVGTTTITASFAGNETYKANSVSYTLNVASSVVHATISFDVDGGDAIAALTDRSALPMELPVATKAGKNFGGWFTDSDKEVAAVPGAAITENTTLYAKWLDPYTVAEAKTVIDANPTGTENQYVAGIISQIDSYNNTYHSITYWISADGTTTNQLQVYSGLIGNAATPLDKEQFSAVTDLELGDEVVVFGTLKLHNSTTYEFDKNNTIYSFNRPVVAVESVSLPATETVEVGSTVTLTATILPENASDKSILWSVQSGSTYASVADGVVSGLEVGEAVIRATSVADDTKYAECTVTVVAADPTKHVVTFDATVDKTTEATELSITKGDLTIAITEGDGRFNNGTDYRPYKNAVFTVSCSAGNITKIEFTCTSSKPITGFADLEGLDKANEVWTGNAPSVSFTASGAQVQMTQLVITYKEDNRAAAGLAWSTDAVELTVGDEFTAPTLSNPNKISASAITIASDNTDLATVSEGVVSLVADATGTATITATFAGNDDYKPAVVSYTITVNAASPVLTDYYEKVTETSGIVEGTYLIVYEDGDNSLAFNGGLTTLDAESNTIAVEITNDNKIGVTEQTVAATFYIDPAAGTVKSASNYYIGVGSWGNGLKQTDKSDTYIHNVFEIDGDGNAQVGIYNADWNTTGGTMRLQYNKGAGQTRFRYFKNGGQQSIVLYKLHNEVIKPEAGLEWDPAEDITLIVGEAFTAPTLLNPNNIDAAEITIESSNTDVATINAGVVELVENATGTTTITATFAGNASYKPATVSYKIKVNPANSIYVSPSLNVNFGSVAKDATVDDKVITVTLTGVDAATATLGGTNPEVFSISPAALTASGDITISASSATAGTFAAKLTISDDAGVAESKVVNISLTVTDPAAEETPISTSTKWVAATAADLVDGAEVIITGVKDEVVYAMGEHKSTNRAAYVATVDGEGVLTPGEGTMAFTLVAQETEGVFALRTSDGKYLYAAASGSNHLKTQDNVDVNAQWTLTVTSAVATGSSNRNVMQFNGGSTKLFSCYASASQIAIQLYVPKQDTPEPVLDWTEVRDELEVNRFYTVCLPKAITHIKGATFWTLANRNAAGTLAYLTEEVASELEPLPAGKPFIIRATAAKLEVVYDGDAVEYPIANGALRGLLNSTMNQEAIDEAATTEGSDIYMLKNNELRKANDQTGNSMVAYRAYVVYNDLDVVNTDPVPAPGRHVLKMPMQKDQAQGFESIEASEKPMKLMIDGQMYILRGEKMYDATGRLVK